MAIDGHGRNHYFCKAYAEGAVVGHEVVQPKDSRFLMVKVVLLKGDISTEIKSKICMAFIAQNAEAHKQVTEIGRCLLFGKKKVFFLKFNVVITCILQEKLTW